MEVAELSCCTAMFRYFKRTKMAAKQATKLRCAIETLKKVKANQKGLFEVTDALKLGKMKHVNILSCCLGVRSFLACENIRFSSLFVAGDVSRGGTSTTQRQKFHTDDANQCLHNKSGSHGVPNINLSNFMCLLVDFGSVVFICQRAPAKLKYFF